MNSEKKNKMKYKEKAVILSDDRIFARMLVLCLRKYCEADFFGYGDTEEFLSVCEKSDIIIIDTRNGYPSAIRTLIPENKRVITLSDSESDGDFNVPLDIEEFEEYFAGLLSNVKPNIPEKQNGMILLNEEKSVLYFGKKIQLTKKEFALLELLYENRGKIVPKQTVRDVVFNGKQTNNDNVYIKYLRTKLEEPFGRKLIYTFRNKGYMMQEKERNTI